MAEFLSFVKDVGFPIAVSVFCLFWLKGTIKELSEVIKKNTEIMQKVCDKLDINKGD